MAGLIGSQYSCKKQLNALPDQSKVDGNVILDQKGAEVALNGAYYRFAEAGDDRGTPSTQTSYAHEILPTWLAGYLDYPYGGGEATLNTIFTEGYTAPLIWTASYTLINAANSVIKGVEELPAGKITEQRRKEILGEARFLRAYGHHRLLTFYGQFWDMNSEYGAMLRKVPVTTSTIAASRSSVADSYAFILEDVDFAIANAPETNEPYYASQWAAKALKARILINRGAPGDYAEVVNLTKDVIENGPFSLEGNLQDIFASKGLSSNEIILGTTPMPAQVNKSDTYIYYGPGYIPTDALTDMLAGDPRENWVLGDIEGALGITKYVGSQIEVGYMFRLTEMYLLRAEAIIRSGGSVSDARPFVREVMERAGVTDFTALNNATTGDQMLLEIYKETVRNMLCEDGQDWFALLRLPFATVQTIRPTLQSKNQYIMPIPRNEFLKNSSIGDQNPGYSK